MKLLLYRYQLCLRSHAVDTARCNFYWLTHAISIVIYYSLNYVCNYPSILYPFYYVCIIYIFLDDNLTDGHNDKGENPQLCQQLFCQVSRRQTLPPPACSALWTYGVTRPCMLNCSSLVQTHWRRLCLTASSCSMQECWWCSAGWNMLHFAWLVWPNVYSSDFRRSKGAVQVSTNQMTVQRRFSNKHQSIWR
jgi:hypothetical protein